MEVGWAGGGTQIFSQFQLPLGSPFFFVFLLDSFNLILARIQRHVVRCRRQFWRVLLRPGCVTNYLMDPITPSAHLPPIFRAQLQLLSVPLKKFSPI